MNVHGTPAYVDSPWILENISQTFIISSETYGTHAERYHFWDADVKERAESAGLCAGVKEYVNLGLQIAIGAFGLLRTLVAG